MVVNGVREKASPPLVRTPKEKDKAMSTRNDTEFTVRTPSEIKERLAELRLESQFEDIENASAARWDEDTK